MVGRATTLQPKIPTSSSKLETSPTRINSLFSRLIFSPNITSNRIKIQLKYFSLLALRIEKLQRDFLWSGSGEGKRNHLVSWDIVCRLKEFGGLGFGKITLRNQVSLGKWLWRFPKETFALWHQVILCIYGTHPNGWDANNIVKWSHCCPLKAIAYILQVFSTHTRFMVGDGIIIRFWEDLWGDQPLCLQFPRLFRVTTTKNLPISAILGKRHLFVLGSYLSSQSNGCGD